MRLAAGSPLPESEWANTSCSSLAMRPRSAIAAARGLLLARVLELSEQDLGVVLTLA